MWTSHKQRKWLKSLWKHNLIKLFTIALIRPSFILTELRLGLIMMGKRVITIQENIYLNVLQSQPWKHRGLLPMQNNAHAKWNGHYSLFLKFIKEWLCKINNERWYCTCANIFKKKYSCISPPCSLNNSYRSTTSTQWNKFLQVFSIEFVFTGFSCNGQVQFV